MLPDAHSHSAVSTGGPSHLADFLMATSPGLPMGTTDALHFSTTLLIVVSSSVTLPVVTSAHPPALPVSSSNHTSTGQVVVNGTRVSFNTATFNLSPHQEGAKVHFLHPLEKHTHTHTHTHKQGICTEAKN